MRRLASFAEIGEDGRKLPELSHQSHTKNEVLRLGFGEVASEWEVVAVTRYLFLTTGERLYPDFRATLEALSANFAPDEIYGFLEEDWRDSPLGVWCGRWNLTNAGNPATWALEAAYRTLDIISRGYPFVWGVAAGGVTPATPEGQFRAHMNTLAAAKKQHPRRLHNALSKHVEDWRAQGWWDTPKKYGVQHFEWTARRIIGGSAYELIAEVHHTDPRDVALRVQEIRRLMNWTDRRGRPTKAAR